MRLGRHDTSVGPGGSAGVNGLIRLISSAWRRPGRRQGRSADLESVSSSIEFFFVGVVEMAVRSFSSLLRGLVVPLVVMIIDW